MAMNVGKKLGESMANMADDIDGLPRPFSPEAVPLVLCCDENYFAYAAVVIQSLLDNREPASGYDIVIITAGDISEERRDKLKAVTKNQPGVSLRFLDLGSQADCCGKLFISRHLSAAAYYRLLIPELFQHYPRVIYLDCDMVVLKDLKPLYEIDLGNKAIGAVYDIGVLSSSINDYLINGLKKPDNFPYINSGLLIMDIAKVREVDQEKNLISRAMENQYEYHDQDVINLAFEGQIKLLPPKWNLLLGYAGNKFSPSRPELKQFWAEYQHDLQDPCIIHFNTGKPASDLEAFQAPLFWQYASKTPFLETMFKQVLDFRPLPKYNRMEKIFSIKNAYNYKIITLLGLNFRFMRKQAKAIIKTLSEQVEA